MQIAAYLKTSLIEWPGKISSVIFTPGCNFRCPFCHNADLVDPAKKRKLPLIKEEKVLTDLKSRKKWVEAVVVTGGEPCLQKDLEKFLKLIKKLNFMTMIHTNGTRPDVIASFLHYSIVDYIALDLKGDLEEYEKFTGMEKEKIIPSTSPAPRQCGTSSEQEHKDDIEKIRKSIELIMTGGIDCEFRTTVVPSLHNLKNLKKLAGQIGLLFENCQLRIENCRWYLQQFRPTNTLDRRFLEIKPYSRGEMEGFQRELQKIIPQTLLRGV